MMFRNKSLTIGIIAFTGLLFLVNHAYNSNKQVNNVANASVEVDIAQADSPSIRFFEDDNGLAIRGTDPVAYFTQGSPASGKPEFSHDWSGATWLFANEEHRDLFAANPEQYAPQYGGFCAWAVSQGYTAPIDPQAWKIVDDKLYLNFNEDIQGRWEKDIPGNIQKADSNWPEVL
ncbi:MAG: YHS domain-containing (seleno)protein [Cyanobacteria bacterium J06631_2]